MNAQAISKSKSLIVLIAFCLPFIVAAQVVEIQCVLTEGPQAKGQLLAFEIDKQNEILILWGTEATDGIFAPKYGRIAKVIDKPLPYVEDDQKSMLIAVANTPEDKMAKQWTFIFDRVNSIITTEIGGGGPMRGRWRGKCKVIDRSNKF